MNYESNFLVSPAKTTPCINSGLNHYLLRLFSRRYFIDNGLFVCHKCDVRGCCNLDHLYLGTAKNNLEDAYKRNRRILQNDISCKHGHARTKENTYINPYGEKSCKECQRNNLKKYRSSKSAKYVNN